MIGRAALLLAVIVSFVRLCGGVPCHLNRLISTFHAEVSLVGLSVAPDSLQGSVELRPDKLAGCGALENCSLSRGHALYNASGYAAPKADRTLVTELELGPQAQAFEVGNLTEGRNYFVAVVCAFRRRDGTVVELETYETATPGRPLPPPSGLRAYLGRQIYYTRKPKAQLSLQWDLISSWTSRPLFYEARCLGLSSLDQCPQCKESFLRCQLECDHQVGLTKAELVDFFVPMVHMSNFGLDTLEALGASVLVCAVRGVSMADEAGTWSVPVPVHLAEHSPVPRLGLMFYDADFKVVWRATLDPSRPMGSQDGLYLATDYGSAQSQYRALDSNQTAVVPLNFPVRFDFRCCDSNSVNLPTLVPFEAVAPEVVGAFPPGQFRRQVPDSPVRDYCFDYVSNYHFETRPCEEKDPRVACVFRIDELINPSEVSTSREKLIYRAPGDEDALEQIVCQPPANVIAWTRRSSGRLSLVWASAAGVVQGDLLEACGCGATRLGSPAIAVDYAAVDGDDGRGAILAVDHSGALFRVQGVFGDDCRCVQLPNLQLPRPASQLIRLTSDWHNVYFLFNVSASGEKYRTSLEWVGRDGRGPVREAMALSVNSLTGGQDKDPMDVKAYNPSPGSSGYLNLDAGKELLFNSLSLGQVFDIRAMAPEMRSIGKAQVPKEPALKVWMTSADSAMSNFSFRWEGETESAVAVTYTLYELKDHYEHCLLEEGVAECRLPPYVWTVKTQFRGSFHLMALDSLEWGKRYLLEAQSRELIKLLSVEGEFPSVNGTWRAEWRDPRVGQLAAILVPLSLLLLALAAALAWKCRTPWRLRNVPRVAKEELVWDPADRLGSGHFADVFRGRRQGHTVALKVQKPTAKAAEKAHFLQEAIIMAGLRHPNVTKVLGISIDSNPYILVLEFINGSSLAGFLRKADTNLDHGTRLKVCLDCARACAYLASKFYIHRDISAKNFLVETVGERFKRAKITDFGLAVDVGAALTPYTTDMPEFPIRHAAPECFRGTFTVASDVYSLGIVFWEVESGGRLPWAEFSNAKELEYWRRLRRLVTLPQPAATADALYQLMLSCWEVEEGRRPTMEEVLRALETLASLGLPKPTPEQQALLPLAPGTEAAQPYSSGPSTDSGRGTGTEELELEPYPDSAQSQPSAQPLHVVHAYNSPLGTSPPKHSATPQPTYNNPLCVPSAEDDYATNIRIS